MVFLFRMNINYKNNTINVCIIQVYKLNLFYQTKRNNIMKWYLLKNDTSKKTSEMEVIGIYNNAQDAPKIENTILTFF